LASIFEPLSTQHFDQTFDSIDSILEKEDWDLEIDGPLPIQYNDTNAYNWYTQEWFNCSILQECIDWDGYIFRDLFTEVQFVENDYTIFVGHHLDWY